MANDWRSPRAKAKIALTDAARAAFARAGRYEPHAPADLAVRQTGAVAAHGDRGPQHRRVYEQERPAIEAAGPLRYTPEGQALRGRAIVQRFGQRAPSLAELARPVGAPQRTIPRGVVLEAETPYTYGDWVCDGVCALVTAGSLPAPLVLPESLASRSYVRRDAERLGVAYEVADDVVLIEEAFVLRKRLPSYDWRAEEVEAYRRAFGYTDRPAPRDGSLLYLGRFGTRSESVQRAYPSERVAAWVEARGGRVFDTRQASPEAFDALAADAETVIADQGSAVFGVMQWRTKTLVELIADGWWHTANLFIGEGAGVRRHVVLETDGPVPIEARLDETLPS